MRARDDYFALAAARPELFANPPGAAFEILMDEADIRRAETASAEVGIAFRDQYLMIVRDAVRFPDGSVGTYIRSVDLYPELPGVVVLPICRGQVLLIRHFRHATRSWHTEIPRGFGIVPDAAETARQELREEIKAEASRLVELGDIYPDSGRGSGRVAMFLAEVEAYGEGEVLEGITKVLPTAVADFERKIAAGELSDGFLLAAYARAKARHLL